MKIKHNILLLKNNLKLIRFFGTSLIATTIDFCLYVLLLSSLSPTLAHIVSATSGMVVNFILQRRWVFNPTRSMGVSFLLSALFSLGGVFLGAILVYFFTQATLLKDFEIIAKLITIAIVFVYNYLTKKIAFGDRV